LLLQLSEISLDDRTVANEDIQKYFEKAEDCFGMISNVKNADSTYYNQSLLNLVLVKCGLFFIERNDCDDSSSKEIPMQHFKECGLLLKRCALPTILEFIRESYASYAHKLPRSQKLSLLVLDSIIQNTYFRFQFEFGESISEMAVNSIFVKHSLFLSKIKPTVVLIHFFEETYRAPNATMKSISRLVRFQVANDGTCMLVSSPDDDLYPEFNIVKMRKGYFDATTPSKFALIGHKVS
jgi:hypothetical protein